LKRGSLQLQSIPATRKGKTITGIGKVPVLGDTDAINVIPEPDRPVIDFENHTTELIQKGCPARPKIPMSPERKPLIGKVPGLGDTDAINIMPERKQECNQYNAKIWIKGTSKTRYTLYTTQERYKKDWVRVNSSEKFLSNISQK
jgi:hypothetical protein